MSKYFFFFLSEQVSKLITDYPDKVKNECLIKINGVLEFSFLYNPLILRQIRGQNWGWVDKIFEQHMTRFILKLDLLRVRFQIYLKIVPGNFEIFAVP